MNKELNKFPLSVCKMFVSHHLTENIIDPFAETYKANNPTLLRLIPGCPMALTHEYPVDTQPESILSSQKTWC